MVQLLHLYMTTGKTITLTTRTFVGKMMSLLLNMLSMFVIPSFQRSLLTSWPQSLSAVILESKKIKSVTASTFSPSNKWLLIIIVFVLNDLVKGQGGRRGNRKEKILLPFYFSFQICPVCISAYRDMP